MTNPKVAIVGGGLSGLSTAAYLSLADQSIDVTILESAARLGGVITTSRIAGPDGKSFLIDHGADMFATNPPAALDLCKQLGVAERLLKPNTDRAGAMIVHRGRLVPIPDGFVLMRATRLWPMLATPLLSPLAKVRLLMERWIGETTEPITSSAEADQDRDVSVAQFVRHRMGSEVLDRIVSPLIAGIYTADIERLSMLATMGPIAKMQKEHGSLAAATAHRKRTKADGTERKSAGARYKNFRAFPGGMIELIETLADALPKGSIETETHVLSVDRDPATGNWLMHTKGPDGEQTRTFDAVVMATPAPVTASLLKTVAGEDIRENAQSAAKLLSEIESASTAIVVLVVPIKQIARPITHFGFVVPAIEKRRILAGSFASVKFDQRCDDEHVIVRVFIGGSTQSELLDNDDAELTKIAVEELTDLIGLSGDPVYSTVVRWNNAMPQYHVGHLARVRKIESHLHEIPKFWMVSNALHGVGIAPLTQFAKKTADAMVKELFS